MWRFACIYRGVSRTPIRLAFEELEKQGFLERLPTRGFRVREITADNTSDAIDVRGVRAGMGARLAAEGHLSADAQCVLDECVA